MCGIVGYTGARDCAQTLLDSLERLEYRGYDSAGIALMRGTKVTVWKTKGRIRDLRALVGDAEHGPSGTVGIGHTRWATHGAPNDRNAHPHRCGVVTLVHNGIIENCLPLRQELEESGAVLHSETDTELIACLIDRVYRGDGECAGDPLSSIRTACAALRGSYALGILFDDQPGRIYAIRRDSPLIVGIGQGEFFLASDVPAFLPYTREYMLLENGEQAVVSHEGVRLYSASGEELRKPVLTASWDAHAAETGGYAHFMCKEIFEQPDVFEATIRPRLRGGLPHLSDELPDALLQSTRRLLITACGTAYHAGLTGKAVLARMAGLPAIVTLASEFRYDPPLFEEGDTLVVISQSGETADSLAALRLAKERGIPTIGVVNVVGSSIAREAEHVLYTRAGPEIAVASTKAFTVQIAVFYLLALAFAQARGVEEPKLRGWVRELERVPDAQRAVLADAGRLREAAQVFHSAHDAFYIGRGLDCPLAEEGSLKLKEISYVHSEAYAAGELKHGTISLVTDGVPVIGLATQEAVYEKLLGNLREVRARGAWVLLIARHGAPYAPELCDLAIELPPLDDWFLPPVTALPLQLLAYYAAVLRGCDVDKPRNLAKSVTVE